MIIKRLVKPCVDIVAHFDATARSYLDPVLYLKGFLANLSRRLADWMPPRMALYLQNRASEVFQADILVGQIGKGVFIDHALRW